MWLLRCAPHSRPYPLDAMVQSLESMLMRAEKTTTLKAKIKQTLPITIGAASQPTKPRHI